VNIKYKLLKPLNTEVFRYMEDTQIDLDRSTRWLQDLGAAERFSNKMETAVREIKLSFQVLEYEKPAN
jgi:hypothetical protein